MAWVSLGVGLGALVLYPILGLFAVVAVVLGVMAWRKGQLKVPAGIGIGAGALATLGELGYILSQTSA